jgi:hypothetical protein
VTLGNALNPNFATSGTINFNNGVTLGAGATVNMGTSAWRFTPGGGTQTIGTTAGSATINIAGGTLQAGFGGGQTLQIASGITIQGHGTLNQSSSSTINNAGTIKASTAGQSFNINPTSFSNSGTLQATNGSTVSTFAGFTSNAGVIDIGAGSVLRTNNNNLINAASGVIRGNGTLNLGAGRVLTNNGTLSAGASPGLMTITGDLVLTPSSVTQIEINGLARGTDPGYDAINVSGNVTINPNAEVHVAHLERVQRQRRRHIQHHQRRRNRDRQFHGRGSPERARALRYAERGQHRFPAARHHVHRRQRVEHRFQRRLEQCRVLVGRPACRRTDRDRRPGARRIPSSPSTTARNLPGDCNPPRRSASAAARSRFPMSRARQGRLRCYRAGR